MTAEILYQGELRTEATHVKSGKKYITDAPVDNNGKGEAFSPTDIVATALGNCIVTIMGIRAAKMGFDLPGIRIDVQKVMGSDPRRISEIKLVLHIPHKLNEKDKTILEKAGLNCPVALSLHPDLKQDVTFIWED